MNKKIENIFKNKRLDSYKFIFLSLSNFSLFTTKAFIDKYQITDYRLILSHQDGPNKKNQILIIELIKKLGIPINKITLIDSDMNYNFMRYISKKKALNDVLKEKDRIFISSINYGFVFNHVKSIINQSEDILIDEGITNWIDIENKYLYIKKFLFLVLFKKLNLIEKKRYKTLSVKIGIFDFPKSHNHKYRFINIKNNFLKILNQNKLNFLNNKNDKILLILAKNFHYTKGIKSFLETFERYIKNKYLKKFDIIIKPHTGYSLDKNDKVINNSVFPIEFYNLHIYKFIFTPINTSAIVIHQLKLFNNDNLFCYRISQDNLSKKIELAEDLEISVLNIS